MTTQVVPEALLENQRIACEVFERAHASWGKFLEVKARDYGPDLSVPDAAKFEQLGYHIGQISQATLAQLVTAFDHADYRLSRKDEIFPDYCQTILIDEVLERIAQDQRFYHLRSEQLWAVWEAVEELAAPIAHVLGKPWKLIHVKAWATPCGSSEYGMNDWHYDGLLPDVYKIMLYLTDVGPEIGTVDIALGPNEVIRLAGSAGTYLLFKSSALYHRGVGPTTPGVVRKALELTMARSSTFDLRPLHAGHACTHPHFPWLGKEFFPLP